MPYSSRSGPPDIKDTYSLLVLNITYRTTVEDLFPLFERYGKVEDVFIPRDKRTGTSRGFAFIRYKRYEEAEKAVQRLDGRAIDGREIMVKFAKYGRNEERIEHGRIRSSSPKRRFRSRSRTPPRGDRSEYRGGRESEQQRGREYRRDSSRERRYRDDRGRDGYRDRDYDSGRFEDEGRGRRSREDRNHDSRRFEEEERDRRGRDDRSRHHETDLKRDLDRSPARDDEEDAATAVSPPAAAVSPPATAVSTAEDAAPAAAAVSHSPSPSPSPSGYGDTRRESEQPDEHAMLNAAEEVVEKLQEEVEVASGEEKAENGVTDIGPDGPAPEIKPQADCVDVQ